MGSDSTHDPQAFPNELPQHVVSLPAFEMAMFPVTVAEFALALSAGAVGLEEPDNWASQSASLLNPVYGLTWYDAIAYACWLAALTNEYWRLPTEAEWEKAARGTDGHIYPWGDNWDSERVNIWQERVTLATQSPQAYGKTTPVDAFPLGASLYGVLDMVGNICEWTSTIIHDSRQFGYSYRHDDGRDDSTVDASFRVLRSGYWLHLPEWLRATCRDSFHTTDKFDWLHGMRLVRDINPS
jgi:formylglycine-generating enzyme required for sulfatase activity